MTLTPEEQRDVNDERIKAAVTRLTRTRQGDSEAGYVKYRVASILYLIDLKRHGYTQARYRATCEYGPEWLKRREG